VFCVLVVTVKRSVDQLLMHYFHNFLIAYAGELRPQTLTGAPPLDSAGDFRLQTPNLPTPGKNPAGTHALDL